MNMIIKVIELAVPIVGVLVNAIIACFAFKAFSQSKKARRYASFETVFAQMLAIQRSFFDHKHIEETKIKGMKESIHFSFQSVSYDIRIEKEHPITLSFAEYYMEFVKMKPDTEFSVDNLKKIWGNFVDELVYEEYFNNCFKYIYNVINLIVQNKELSDEEKRAYVERVQALLNKNEMFCYFLNLISFYSIQGMTESKYIKTLKKYKFFDDLFRSYQFSDIIKKSIPNDVINAFWEKGSVQK